MPSSTENYKLIKPADEDFYDVQVFNENVDIIDDALKKQQESISHINHVTKVTLSAEGWDGSEPPFSQTVEVPGATADLEPILVSALEDGVTVADQKAYMKAFGIVCSGTAFLGDGTATFKVYKKPAVDIVVGLKGV